MITLRLIIVLMILVIPGCDLVEFPQKPEKKPKGSCL
jgi:hypothetical protein